MAGKSRCKAPCIEGRFTKTPSVSYVTVQFGFLTDVTAWRQSISMDCATMSTGKSRLSGSVSSTWSATWFSLGQYGLNSCSVWF